MGSEEERVLENQLELQLHEQRDSLTAIDHALLLDPTNSELLEVHEELVQAIKDAEEGLLHLKRARLLSEADTVLCSTDIFAEEEKVEPLDPADVEPEPLEEKSFSVGSKCRFRYKDGRWYNGQVMQLDNSVAKISFLTPTSENMLMCKFFLQQRCRFGSNCRLSHGVDVQLTSLKEYAPTIWKPSLAGSSIWAVSNANAGIWRAAELESWDEKAGVGQVVFRDDGSSVKLGAQDMVLSEYADMSDIDSDSSLEQSDYSGSEEEEPQGLGFMDSTNLQKGVQTETAIFAKWENHTRGMASKMMANMGYQEGMGLGLTGQGMVDPIPVKVLPPKQSLDHALKSHKVEGNTEKQRKKRTRGGKRKREKRFAEAIRAAKEEEESAPDVFSLINTQLAMHGEASNGSMKKQQSKGSGEGKKVDRKMLVAYENDVKDLKVQVLKFEQMAEANKREKPVYDAAMKKLVQTRKALAEAEAVHASASDDVVSKEKDKRWLKF
ncbi:putative transcription factor C3H family [Medicago truncatula]|uniref:Putative transcription factor C3H family n=1 Tax=Medicago truncatula TaxID=3880 RepID=A0A072UVS7_MEDTR|nr:zinc finger CCCH domain-containing protein 18 [Medicago truncatula]KEH33909.1 zinc finger CCCH-type with G patch domain protein [Medicago truncatula]RHN67174.1 putative transcription factor C3H family [Medicago truncatula]